MKQAGFLLLITLLLFVTFAGCVTKAPSPDLPTRQPFSSQINVAKAVYHYMHEVTQSETAIIDRIITYCRNNRLPYAEGQNSYELFKRFLSDNSALLNSLEFPKAMTCLLSNEMPDDDFFANSPYLFVVISQYWNRFTEEQHDLFIHALLAGQLTPGPVPEQIFPYLSYIRSYGMERLERLSREVYKKAKRLMLPCVHFREYIPKIFFEVIAAASSANESDQKSLLDSVYYSYVTPLVPMELVRKLYESNPCKAFCFHLLATGDIEALNSDVSLLCPSFFNKHKRFDVLPSMYPLIGGKYLFGYSGRTIYSSLIAAGISDLNKRPYVEARRLHPEIDEWSLNNIHLEELFIKGDDEHYQALLMFDMELGNTANIISVDQLRLIRGYKGGSYFACKIIDNNYSNWNQITQALYEYGLRLERFWGDFFLILLAAKEFLPYKLYYSNVPWCDGYYYKNPSFSRFKYDLRLYSITKHTSIIAFLNVFKDDIELDPATNKLVWKKK